MIRSADISADGLFRWSLTRRWAADGEPDIWVAFCGLNPSTADAQIDDPTIRKEIEFAKLLGANALMKVNISAYRATYPSQLKAFSVSHQREWFVAQQTNQFYLQEAAKLARTGRGVFAAWGVRRDYLAADVDLARKTLGAPLFCLGETKDGHPRHPLYLPYSAKPKKWRA
jgi:hypothetical protein